MLSATRKIRTSRTSGIAIDMIVRGWRSRAPSEIWPPSSAPSPRGRRERLASGRRAGVDSAGGGVGVGHGRLFTHALAPALSAGLTGTRRLPRARLTSLDTGSGSGRYTRPARVPARHWSGRRAFLRVSTGPRRRRCTRRRPRPRCARRDTATPGSPISAANAAACSLPVPPTTRALCASTQSTNGAERLEPRVLEHRAAVLVERVRDADEPALRADLLDRRRGRTGRAPRRARGTGR